MQAIKQKIKMSLMREAPSKWECALIAAIIAVIMALFAHTDILETSNHTWLFLENLFSGNFFGYYENVFAHDNNLYYINAAHYNILVYAIMGLWQLPVFLVHKLFSLTLNEMLLMHYTKLLCAGLAILCGILTSHIAVLLNVDKKLSKWQCLMFILSPITLLSAFAMGQYDVLCLAIMLFAFLFYAKKKYTAFSLIMGIAICCKFFAVFWLIPLLLLCEKRVLHLLKYAIFSLWVYAPTALLFSGRDGDMSFFNKLISERLFSPALSTGAGNASLFLLAFVLLCLLCRLYTPKNCADLLQTGIYSGLAVFAFLFLFVAWHPQWLVLIVPFTLLISASAKNKITCLIIDLALYLGFFVSVFMRFQNQIEANMLDFGFLSVLFNVKLSSNPYNNLAFYFSLFPYVIELSSVLLAGSFLAYIFLFAPKNGKTLESTLCAERREKLYPRAKLWIAFIFGFCCLYIAPVMFEWLKAVTK